MAIKLEAASLANLSDYEVVEQPAASSVLEQLWLELKPWFPTLTINETQSHFFNLSNLEVSSIQRVNAFLLLQNTVCEPHKHKFTISIIEKDGKHQCALTILASDTFSVTLLRSETSEKLDTMVRPRIENGQLEKLLQDFTNDLDRMNYTFVNGEVSHTFHAADRKPLEEKLQIFHELYHNEKQHKALYYLGMQGFEGDVCIGLDENLLNEICLASIFREFHFNLDSSGLIIYTYQHNKALDKAKHEQYKNQCEFTAEYEKVQCNAVFIISDDSFYCVDASIKKTPCAIPNLRRNRLHSKCILS